LPSSALLVASLFACAVLPAQAPQTYAPMPKPGAEHFRALRDAVRAEIGDGVVVLLGARKPDDMGAFWQTQDFFYLSGVNEPELALILRGKGKDKGEVVDELLVPPFSRFAAQWEGEFLAPGEEAQKKSGFAVVANVRNLTGRLEALLGGKEQKERPVLWTLTEAATPWGGTPGQTATALQEQVDDGYDGRGTREQQFCKTLQERFPGIEIRDLAPVLHRMRARKRDAEIALLRRSSEVAAEGLAAAMRAAKPGLREYQLAAVARYVFSLHGCGKDAYGAIVGAGKNGCVLHYMKCDAEIADGDLVVMDYAPTLHGYASDVTRTFPAGGTFTPAQRKLVQDVHDIQQALIAQVKPGASLSKLGRECAAMLRERGYRSDHGPCHHVGLAVHDPSSDQLKEGMVITVEPGAYLRDQKMGCRIEDTILVTENGCEVLSKGCPSSPDAIEAFLKAQGPWQMPTAGGASK
jgi:Xaa-Pro aminopeptidase